MDADACPVKEEITGICEDREVKVIFIASNAHRKTSPDKGVWVYVDSSKEAADLYIMNHIKSGDLLVTQDIGLSSIVLPKGVYAISPRGKEFREETISTALDFRYLSAKERRKGKYGKGPKPFTSEDRERFVSVFKKNLSNFAGDQ